MDVDNFIDIDILLTTVDRMFTHVLRMPRPAGYILVVLLTSLLWAGLCIFLPEELLSGPEQRLNLYVITGLWCQVGLLSWAAVYLPLLLKNDVSAQNSRSLRYFFALSCATIGSYLLTSLVYGLYLSMSGSTSGSDSYDQLAILISSMPQFPLTLIVSRIEWHMTKKHYVVKATRN